MDRSDGGDFMGIFQLIQQRVALPGDSDTRRAQKSLAVIVLIVAAMERHRSWTGEAMRIRVGINTGPVVAGVIGQQKFIYDLWGDAVNVASRMESNGLSNEIQVTQAVKDKLAGLYEFEERGPIYVKGKGEMVTYLMRQGGAVTSDQ
jgi:class 3 adenylate cyclase